MEFKLAAVFLLIACAASQAGVQAQTTSSRKLLQAAPTPVQQALTNILCFADQTENSATQFLGLTGGTQGLPAILNNAVTAANNVAATIESQLGVQPAAVCSATPALPTAQDAIKGILCSVTNLQKSLTSAVNAQALVGLPPVLGATLNLNAAQLTSGLNTVEASLLEFIFGITC